MTLVRQLGLVSAVVLTGCGANFNSIYRTLDLGDPSGTGPRAVAIDVKQRAIFASSRTVYDSALGREVTTQVVCPEASPDALSATSIGAALTNALSSTTPTGTPLTRNQLQLAGAVGEGAASIGLRTQSIQLMRDGLVFNCLLFMNGAVDQRDAYALQRRSQNFTLGLLAIEQLTGAIKADQAAVTATGAAATGSDNTDKEAAAVEAAKSKQSVAKTELDRGKLELRNLRKERDDLQIRVGNAVADHRLAEAAAKGKAADTNEKRAEAKALADLNSERSALEAKQRDVEDKELTVAALARAEKATEEQVGLAQEALNLAKSRVRASTNATSILATSGGRTVIMTEKVAASVVAIVRAVLDESGRGEACNALLAALNVDGLSTDANDKLSMIATSHCSQAQIDDAPPAAKANILRSAPQPSRR